MKVLEIIKIAGWIDGSGWSYGSIYSNQIVDVTRETLESPDYDWSWWDKSEPVEGEDLEISVEYYRPDYDPMFDNDEPIAQFKTWESEITE